MPVTGLGTSRAAALKLAVWRQDIVAVPGRSPSSHDPAPARAATEYSSNETPSDVASALAFGRAPGSVGADLGVVPQPSQHDRMQGTVELAVTGAVQPMPGHLPGRRRDRVDPSQGSKGGLRTQPTGIRPAHQELGSADRPNTR